MLDNYFVVSLLVLQSFFFQCSVQTYQLKSIPLSCNGFVRLKQYTIPCWSQQLQNIILEPWIFGFPVDVDAWPGLPHDIFVLDCRSGSTFHHSTRCKKLSLFAVRTIVHT